MYVPGTRQSLRAEDGVLSICCHMLAYKLSLIEFITIGASSEKILIRHLLFRHYFLLLDLVVNLS